MNLCDRGHSESLSGLCVLGTCRVSSLLLLDDVTSEKCVNMKTQGPCYRVQIKQYYYSLVILFLSGSGKARF